jgi:hypothetical protein
MKNKIFRSLLPLSRTQLKEIFLQLSISLKKKEEFMAVQN